MNTNIVDTGKMFKKDLEIQARLNEYRSIGFLVCFLLCVGICNLFVIAAVYSPVVGASTFVGLIVIIYYIFLILGLLYDRNQEKIINKPILFEDDNYLPDIKKRNEML